MPPPRPQTDVTNVPQDAQPETLGFTAPRHILTAIFALMLGGGAGAVATGTTLSRPAESVASPWLTKAEVEQIAAAAEVRSNIHGDQVAAAALADCRRDLAATQAAMTATLARLEGKVDRLADDVGQLKVDVAEMRTRRK